MKKWKRKEDGCSIGGIFIPAGLLLGMGVGFLVNNIPGGLFIGLGAGMVAYGITCLIYRRKKK
jgi:hypothetical protein